MSKISWEGTIVDDMPQPKGRVLQEETKKLIDFINKNRGNIVKLRFSDIKTAQTAFNRLRYAKKRQKIHYNRISRQNVNVYVDLR